MGLIDNSIKRSVAKLTSEARISLRTGIITTWRGRYVIPVEKWKEIVARFAGKYKKLYSYIPEDYIEYPLIFHAQSQEEEKARQEWFKDWIDYLMENKKPGLGEYRCRKCILHPKTGERQPFIRNLILLEEKDTKFPCDVVNHFNCPFKDEESRATLVLMKMMQQFVEDSFRHADSFDIKNEGTYFVDFENDNSTWYRDYWGDDIHHTGTIEEMLGELKVTGYPVDTIQNTFDVLTSDKLKEIFEQYLDYLKEDKSNSEENRKPSNDIVIQEELMKENLEHFKRIRKKIKIEDICDSHGRNMQEEQKEFERMKGVYEYFATYKPSLIENQKNPRSGNCLKCDSFANIKCINCNKWVCVNHWKEHGISVHKYSVDMTVQSKKS